MQTQGQRKKARLHTAAFVAVCVALMAFFAVGCSSASSTASSSAEDAASSEAGVSSAVEAGMSQGEASSPAPEDAAMRIFTDSLGREVEVPANLTKIAPSGHTATQVLLTMAPEKLVGLSQELSDDQKKYLGLETAKLPVFGAIFGNKGDLNKEELAASGCQIIIDTGEPKDGIAEDLDALQEQVGIPAVHITTTLDKWGDAYRMLGDLLGMPERGEELGAYCDAVWAEAEKTQASLSDDERVNMAYLGGDAGLNAIAQGSYQGKVIDMFANNVVQVEKAAGSGLGNEISLEQLAVWNPDLIVFQQGSIYDTVGSDAAWAGIAAIENNNYYEVPAQPYCWLNNPPTVNQVMGLQWLPRLLYPSKYDDDLAQVTKKYYKTFYGYDLSDDEYSELVSKAVFQNAL